MGSLKTKALSLAVVLLMKALGGIDTRSVAESVDCGGHSLVSAVSWMVMRERGHRYRISTRWTGNSGSGTSAYKAYSRNLEITAAGKGAPIPGSSDPLFRGYPSRYNPEELLIGSLSACHMLWVLHLCADAGIVVTEYVDDAEGEMVEHADGSGEFTRVVLRPKMKITDAARVADAAKVHDRAHEVCAMARSVNFEVACEPEIKVG